MQKSNNNLISQIQNEVCDILNKDYELQGLDFIAENRFDIETEISARLKKLGVCCLVMTPTLTFQGIADTHTDIIYQIDNLTVQITEYVPINRAKNRTNIKTCQDIAIRVADVLGGPTTNNWQNFQLVDIQTGEDNGLLISKVTFSCLAQGHLSAIPAPYDPSVKIPFATKTQLDELSVHFESEISNLPIVDAYTKTESDDKFQPKGDYATKSELDKKLNNSSEFITLSTTNDGLKMADNAGVYDTTYSVNQIVTNYPDSNYKTIELPTEGGKIATENYVQTHTSAIVGYNDTLLSGITEDDQTVEFYILTKNK